MVDSLKFGTSGLRGLATDLVGAPSAAYTAAFLRHLSAKGGIAPGAEVLVGRDLRESSPAIAGSVIGAVAEAGFVPVDCGELSTPALALFAQTRRAPAIMVTGSHIPADRNGLKFYLASGEITKADEAGILVSLKEMGGQRGTANAARPAPEARQLYLDRYRTAFPPDTLGGLRIGVFQHSSVARDDLVTILSALGAEVVSLGRSDHFVPIDTEAVSAADAAQARDWVATHRLDALVSTDGDADRPLLADETGAFLRGDVLGILTAQFLGADAVVTPVTSNSSIEGLGSFAQVLRTRVGSPFVIDGMEQARAAGARVVVGFEANGGVLLGSDAAVSGRAMAALPTRDAFLPILSVLAAARGADLTLSAFAAKLPPRFARSDRLEHVPQENTAAFLARLGNADFVAGYFAEAGAVASVSSLDGLRFILVSGDVVHYRASGNAPEMRCYTEAATAERADALLTWGLKAAEKQVH
ncbi:MAG TPA: phosphomannomutase [Devosiaceae bacterium]|nr:phosphomannomutase [Devosiaceae bacterium]